MERTEGEDGRQEVEVEVGICSTYEIESVLLGRICGALGRKAWRSIRIFYYSSWNTNEGFSQGKEGIELLCRD